MIKDILDNIGSIVATVTSGSALPNPYALIANPIIKLKNGYGVRYGAGDNVDYGARFSTTLNRNIDVMLTKQFNSVDLSAASRQAAESTFIDTMRAVIKAIKQDPTLASDSSIVDIYYVSDDGIELLEAEKMLVLVTTISFRIVYNEIY